MKYAARTGKHNKTWLEALEPRQLRTAVPDSGQDIQLSISPTNGQVVETVTPEQASRRPVAPFQWYDATLGGKLRQLNGQIENAWLDGYYMWPVVPGQGRLPGPVADEAGTRSLARDVAASGTKVVIMDNETWHFDIRYYSKAAVDKSIADMKQVISWIRSERPQLKIGIYGYMSQSDDYASSIWSGPIQANAQNGGWYTENLPRFPEEVADWQATSEYLRPLSQSVDYIFPVLYTGTTDVDGWTLTAKNTIQDSRRYGKPVIPFIWPYYHEGAGALGTTEIPRAYWERQLEVVHNYADGAVIWSSWQATGNEQWVQATLAEVAATQPSGQAWTPLPLLAPVSSVPEAPAAPTASVKTKRDAVKPSVGLTVLDDPSFKDRFATNLGGTAVAVVG